MTPTFQIKRRLSGSAGAPATLKSGELATNFVDQYMYVGTGDSGNGTATAVQTFGIIGLSKAQLVPGDGNTAQVLTKNSNSAYDFSWSTPIKYLANNGLLLNANNAFSIDTTIVATQANLANYSTTATIAGLYVNNTQLSANLAYYTNTATLSANYSNNTQTAALYTNTATLTANYSNTATIANTYTNTSVLTATYVSNANFTANLANYSNTATIAANYTNNATLASTYTSQSQLSANLANYSNTATIAATYVSNTFLTGNYSNTAQMNTAISNAVQGLSPKTAARAAVTTNMATLANTVTVDGVALAIGDRVVVTGQSNSAQNGIYVVQNANWTRAPDMNTWAQVPGAYIFSVEGTLYGGTGWVTTNDPDVAGTINTTAITWTQFTGAGEITPGSFLTKSGNVLSANVSGLFTVTSGQLGLNTPLTALGSVSPVANGIPYFNGTSTATSVIFTNLGYNLLTATSATAAQGFLSLGTMSTQNANSVAITGGTIDNVAITNSTMDMGTF